MQTWCLQIRRSLGVYSKILVFWSRKNFVRALAGPRVFKESTGSLRSLL